MLRPKKDPTCEIQQETAMRVYVTASLQGRFSQPQIKKAVAKRRDQLRHLRSHARAQTYIVKFPKPIVVAQSPQSEDHSASVAVAEMDRYKRWGHNVGYDTLDVGKV
jgi:hypothetical protein